MELIGGYKNGNYNVSIYDDGTKIRENDLDFFEAEFPESIDLKITNRCDMNCRFCHENSDTDGEHGNLFRLPFIDSIHPYTEIAIGGGNPLCHPDFAQFLKLLQERNIIANVTVNQKHFIENIPIISQLSDAGLIRGLGVSFRAGTIGYELEKLISSLRGFPNAVVHMINGVHSIGDFENISYRNLKLLVLGYKQFGRGEKLYTESRAKIDRNMKMLYNGLATIISCGWFHTVSLDNLAINQLNVKRLMSDDEWNKFYMGDDGRDGDFTSASMYIDAVRNEFAKNSCSEDRFPITENISKMYQFLKETQKCC